MEEKTLKERMAEARQIYFEREFRSYMRGIQGFRDEDFERVAPIIKRRVIESKEEDPYQMFENILRELSLRWEKPNFPVHADWHHYMLPGIVLASLRNCGYEITDRDIEEAMLRGEKFPGGSCGFAGTCGAAFGVGIVISIVNRTTPLHEAERCLSMQAVIETLNEIKKYPRRCCKRSNYIGIMKAVDFLHRFGFDKLNPGDIICTWSRENRMCVGVKCPFFNRGKNGGG